MRMNHTMTVLLREYAVEVPSIRLNCEYPVWVREDAAHRPYWGVSHFGGMDADRKRVAEQNLSWLEWDGNEVHLEAQRETEVPGVLEKAIGILKFWKQELETRYPQIPFYLFASFDNGDGQIVDRGELPIRSVTLRFWADRGSSPVDLTDFDHWEQPAILISCNQ